VAVWAQILNTDLTDGIRSKSGSNQIRFDWVGTTLQAWVDAVPARQFSLSIAGPYGAGPSGSIAPQAETTLGFGHGLGVTPKGVAAYLYDGAFAGRCTWRASLDATNVNLTLFNASPAGSGANATVYYQAVLFY
jgi:hypothetical protein